MLAYVYISDGTDLILNAGDETTADVDDRGFKCVGHIDEVNCNVYAK